MRDNGGPAFPRAMANYDKAEGMSLRDYFAGQWLLGAALEWARTSSPVLAKVAYEVADAMLAERAK